MFEISPPFLQRSTPAISLFDPQPSFQTYKYLSIIYKHKSHTKYKDLLMGGSYACQCPTTGYITYCSCGCNTCGDPCSVCPTWYWWLVGVGALVGIIIAVAAIIVRRRRRLRRQQNIIEINLNPNGQTPAYYQNQQYPQNGQNNLNANMNRK